MLTGKIKENFTEVVQGFHSMSDLDAIERRPMLNNPFYYEIDPLTQKAVDQLQDYLREQKDWNHNFGTSSSMDANALGKMFGVLVVENPQGEIGFLAAFSGKIDDANNHPGFVPAIFDLLNQDGFFREAERELLKMNNGLAALELDIDYGECRMNLERHDLSYQAELQSLQELLKAKKELRKLKRESLDERQVDALNSLNTESHGDHFILKDFRKQAQVQRAGIVEKMNYFEKKIQKIKEQRKSYSAQIQQQLFESYQFMNAKGESKHLLDLFSVVPPAGAGECAAPRLLNFAYQHSYRPISIAEFWWGQTPAGEIRRHGQYYPACRSKCFPILTHMLEGLAVEPNALESQIQEIQPEIIFEDDSMIVLVKPHNYLSVQGKSERPSIQSWLNDKFKNLEGPVIVHRLDMSTSGLMVAAKTLAAYHALQDQFAKKTVKKKYIALLDGLVKEDNGKIELPLRVDLDDRPRQMVCEEHGKKASTLWKVAERRNDETLVHFFPITGRTHQLRVHAAHAGGLNTPIKGDELYGTADQRLHLHAAALHFLHPITGRKMSFKSEIIF